MSSPADMYQGWVASAVLGVGDATKEIKAAPGAKKRLCITKLTLMYIVSAAQTVDVESSDGTVELIKGGLSLAAGVELHFGSRRGYPFPDNTALRIQPSAAGCSVLVTAEGYLDGEF